MRTCAYAHGFPPYTFFSFTYFFPAGDVCCSVGFFAVWRFFAGCFGAVCVVCYSVFFFGCLCAVFDSGFVSGFVW